MTDIPAARAGYRPDIDGLRAIAVLGVLWFHSGLAGLPGGFAGVDVFFVISGYLIAGIVQRDIAAGEFRLAAFYQRRVRRIAPALIVVLIVTLMAGCVFLLPGALVKVARSELAALTMTPNVHFWLEGSGGYFGLSKRLAPPLLHMWSLGVEEQFYLLFPVFLMLAARWRIVRPAIVAVVAISFGLCVIASARAAPAAFYLLPMRAWELALGALLAVGVIDVPARLRLAVAATGLALVAIGFAWINADGAFPAWRVVIPAVGAMLLIGGGPATPVNRLIAAAPLVWIGRISYSLYLWHLPVLVFLGEWRGIPKLPLGWTMAAFAISFALAWTTYHFIEQPARRRSVAFRRVLAGVATGCVIVLVGAVAAIAAAGWPQRFSPRVLAMAAQYSDRAPLAGRCEDVALDDIEHRCLVGTGRPAVAIWGDSHAAAESAGIAAALAQPTVVLSAGGCIPMLATSGANPGRCEQRNRAVLQWLIARPHIHTVVLVAYWSSYARPPASPATLWRGVQAAVSALPGRRVVIVAGVPEPGIDVPWVSAIREHWGRPPPRWPCPPAAVPVTGATIVDLSHAFCAHPEPWRLFTDGNHASMTANRDVIAPAIRTAVVPVFDAVPAAAYPPRP